MMKKLINILLVSIIITLMLLTGCSKNKETSAPAAKWDTVVDSSIVHSSIIEGFHNENFGLTVGFDGEIYYTNDQGKTWAEAENSSKCLYCLDIVMRILLGLGVIIMYG
ncbi:MAG: hypothetical protein GX271_01110 [Clostridiales bacterium]|nr:hypothetical protein [Clostridiales bacterium]